MLRFRRFHREGFALIVVLAVIAILAVVLLEFNYETRVNLHIADNAARGARARYCAEAGIQVAASVLAGHPDFAEEDDVKDLLAGAVDIPVGDGHCAIQVVEESGKINLNRLKDDSGELNRPRVDQFLNLIDVLNRRYGETSPVSYDLAPAVIDWVDADDDVTYLDFVQNENAGAEDAWYAGQDPPRMCKNAPMDSVAELLSVKGVTPELYAGRPGDEEARVAAVPGLREYVTVYGEGLVDVNKAPLEVLESLSVDMDSALAQAIVSARELTPFESVEELLTVPGMTAELFKKIEDKVTVSGKVRYYIATAEGVCAGFSRKVEAVLRRDQGGTVTVIQRREP